MKIIRGNSIRILILIAVINLTGKIFSQSFNQGDVILNANIGAPHLFKGIVKLATGSKVFKENFGKYIEVSNVTGINPIAIKGEYGFTKYFSLGFSYSFWTLNLDVKDFYNVQNQNGAFIKDSVDIYKFRISSKSFGIRPNLHIPFKNRKHDLFVGIGLGITKNKMTIDFSSTDAGRFVKQFGKDLEYDLSLPGGVYIAPSLGYRYYFGKNFGLNAELGYEKGAIVQGGLVLRFATKK